MDGFVSAPQQALRKTILSVFPPAPKPRGVIAPDFIYPKMDVIDDVVMADDAASESESEVEDLPLSRPVSIINRLSKALRLSPNLIDLQ